MTLEYRSSATRHLRFREKLRHSPAFTSTFITLSSRFLCATSHLDLQNFNAVTNKHILDPTRKNSAPRATDIGFPD